jgi:hypothetical protein
MMNQADPLQPGSDPLSNEIARVHSSETVDALNRNAEQLRRRAALMRYRAQKQKSLKPSIFGR